MKKIFTLLAILMATVTTAWADPVISGTTATVSSLADLQTALTNSSVSTVIVSQELSITSDVSLDGQGKIVQVTTPYCDETGNCLSSGYSTYCVFSVSSGANLTIRNMTIYGGYHDNDRLNSYGGILVNGKLYAENVVVSRSYRGVYVPTGGTAVFKNCAIVRNACYNGGGLKIEAGAKAFMDGCSFSENRSLAYGGGGGAVENLGLFYANNTVIANNCSSEHGGAINILGRGEIYDYDTYATREATVYLMNCTVSGNATAGESDLETASGGGIAIRAGRLYAVNTVFKDNYHFYNNSSTSYCRSDISRVYDDSYDYCSELYLYNCVYGAIEGDNGIFQSSGCTVASDNDPVFASYRSDGILAYESSVTPDFKHSVLAHTSDGEFNLYAPAGNTTATGGVKTYLDYTTDLGTINIGYGESGSITALGDLTAATSDKQVTTYYEGGTRSASQIGASGYVTTQYYTLKLKSGYTGGTVSGATIFGDSYVSGSNVTVSATANSGYEFAEWYDRANGEVISSDNPATITMNHDVTLWPLFRTEGTSNHFVLVKNVTGVSTITGEGEYASDASVSLSATCSTGYTVTAYTDQDGKSYSGSSIDFTMPAKDVILTPTVERAPQVTVTCSEGGTVSGLANEGFYDIGATATLTANAKGGYEFKGWKTSSSATEYISTNATYSFTVNSDVTLYAEFEKQPTAFTSDGTTGDIDVNGTASDYPWARYDTKGAPGFISTNQDRDDSESASTITITPNAGVTTYDLSFNYQVSSEDWCDYLKISVTNNGTTTTVADAISGDGSEQSFSATGLTGTTTISLSYSKDGSVPDYDDCGYIYNIKTTTAVTDVTFDESTTTQADITAVKGKKANVTIKRTFYKTGGNNTICLPFSLTADQLATSPLAGFTKLQEFSTATILNAGEQDEYLQLTLTPATAIEAGKPYIISWAKGDNLVNPVFSNVTITADRGSASTESCGVQFYGTLVPYAVEAGDKGYMFVNTSGYLRWPDASGNIKGFRCYFTVNYSASAKLFRGMNAYLVDGTETGISSVNSDQLTVNKVQKLLEQGKVVIISNGKRYSLDGKPIE